MAKFLTASAVIFAVLVLWTSVQRAYLAFARRHPQLGPFRASGGGCSCSSGRCSRE